MAKRSFRILLGTLISATLALSAHAQDYSPQSDVSHDFNTGATNSTCGFEVFASLMYLQPSSGSLEYGTLISPFPIPTPNWADQSIDPSFSAAFNIGVRYGFAASNNDLEVNWTHLDARDTGSFDASPNQFVGPSFEIGPDADIYKHASADVHFGYDSIDLDAGHYVFDGGPVQLRVFGGLQFARVAQDLTATFRSTDGLSTNSNTTDSSFTGVGPRLGVKLQYAAGRFDFLGEMGAAALIGDMQSRIDFSNTSPALTMLGIPSPNTQALTSPSATQVIPSLDFKLGSAYTFPIRNYGQLKIEGGYQAAIYFDAVSQYTLTEVAIPPVDQSVGVFLETAEHLQSNFFVHGPYLKASWEF